MKAEKSSPYRFPFFNQHVRVPEGIRERIDTAHSSEFEEVRHCIGLIVTNLLALGEVAYSRNSNFYTWHGTQLFTRTSMKRAVDAAVASGYAVKSHKGYRSPGYRTGLASTIAAGLRLTEFGLPVKLELDIESLPLLAIDKRQVFNEGDLAAVISGTKAVSPESLTLTPRLDKIWEEAVALNVAYWNRIKVDTIGLPKGTVCMEQVGLTRVFKKGGVGRWFQRGGMSYQELSKSDRARLLLDGEPVVELDYHAMHPHLMYAWENQRCPDNFYERVRDLCGCTRDSAKQMTLAVVNADSYKDLSAGVNFTKREGKGNLYDELKDAGLEPLLVVAALVEAHPVMENYVLSGQANRLMLAESDIMTAILMKLMQLGIPALPVHDSIVAPAKHRATVKKLMLEEYHRQTTFDIAVD